MTRVDTQSGLFPPPIPIRATAYFSTYFFSLSRIVLVLFVFLVLYHGRQVEIDSSLDFLWKQQARKELEEMTEMRRLGIIFKQMI